MQLKPNIPSTSDPLHLNDFTFAFTLEYAGTEDCSCLDSSVE